MKINYKSIRIRKLIINQLSENKINSLCEPKQIVIASLDRWRDSQWP